MKNVDGWTNGQKQLFRAPFGGTLATVQDGPSVVSFLPLLALVAFGVFTFLTLLAFLAFLALFTFASHIGIGGAKAFAFPCVKAFAFTGWRRSYTIPAVGMGPKRERQV